MVKPDHAARQLWLEVFPFGYRSIQLELRPRLKSMEPTGFEPATDVLPTAFVRGPVKTFKRGDKSGETSALRRPLLCIELLAQHQPGLAPGTCGLKCSSSGIRRDFQKPIRHTTK